jgi:hypothetical protein
MGEAKVRCMLVLLAVVQLALGACENDSHELGAGTETNWLRACDGDADCSVGSCVCGLCSEGCRDDGDCPSGLRCEREGSALHANACDGHSDVRGLCAPECDEDAECGPGRSCEQGACAPDELARGGRQDGGSAGAGESSGGQPTIESSDFASDGPVQLVVDAHLDKAMDCAPDLERPIGSGVALYDIAGPTGDDSFPGMTCRRPYVLQLRVRNLLPEDVLVSDVEVLLMSIQEQTILFSQTSPELPNPFVLSVTGSLPPAGEGEDARSVIFAEVIPVDYAEQLEMFIGSQLAIRVRLVGETLSGEPVRANVFEYRVQLCQGCLAMCRSDLEAQGSTAEELLGDACADGSGADGRVCINPDC